MAQLRATTKDKLEVSLPQRQANILKEILQLIVDKADKADFAHKLASFLKERAGWFGRFVIRFIPVEQAEDFILDWIQDLIEDLADKGADQLEDVMDRHGVS